MANRLQNATSPYLLQHADNPVDWYPWGEEALAKAKKEDKMIFLSIGYSSCHWCHVMEHESFEDEEIARILNSNFVPIKVDREERPDIDALYMEAVQMISGHGGWPLNVWLTPGRVPVFGGTYFPPEQMHGRPSFRQILLRMIEIYSTERDMIEQRADQIRQAVSRDLLKQVERSSLSDGQLHEAARLYHDNYDPTDGGFSAAPKFPMAMGISFMLKYGYIYKKSKYHKMAAHSLESMIRGGIYDHLGGGFHRYSVDARWHVPHFEKMLYDNALLLGSLADAWCVKPLSLYRHTADETLAFLQREMMHPDGGFYSALDADTEGEEGYFYIWTEEEIREELAGFPEKEIRLFCDVYNVSKHGNWEGSNILHITGTIEQFAGHGDFTTAEAQAVLYRAREVLLKARESRTRPGLDDKIITSWNAVLLKSLCRAARSFDDKTFRNAALQLAEFLSENAFQDGKLMRIFKDGNISQAGFLDDVALLAEAYTHVFEITADPRWLEKATELCGMLIDDFYDKDVHGFFFTSGSHEQLLSRNRDLFDNATPSGNSAAIAALFRCGLLSGEQRFSEVALEAADAIMQTASKHATSFGYLLDTALQLHEHKAEIVISGPTPGVFKNVFTGADLFNRILISSPDASKIIFPPYKGKIPVKGTTACYVCEGFSCQAPVTDPEYL